MRRVLLVPVALVVFVLLSQAGQAGRKSGLYVALHAQEAPAARSPTFEVASVKVNKSGDPGINFRMQPGGRFTVTNAPLREMIRMAYQVQPFQIVGGPDWLTKDRFDVVAKGPENTPFGPAAQQSPVFGMIRSLLADRFKLKAHREARDMPTYALVLARSDGRLGPRLEKSTLDCAAMMRARAGRGGPAPGPPPPLQPGARPQCGMIMTPASMAGDGVSMAQIAQSLSIRASRVVTDKTGLEGVWAFDMSFAPEFTGALGPPPPGAQLPTADPNAPSLFTALQEQLGLKLDSQHGPVDVLVIDSVEHPTED